MTTHNDLFEARTALSSASGPITYYRLEALTSPSLVVAYALAGTVDIDMSKDPLGTDINGEAVYLHDVWPMQEEVRQVVAKAVTPEVFARNYASVFKGDEHWRSLPNASGELFAWNPASTYIQEPPFFQSMSPEPEPIQDIRGARVLALLDDSITTDHISQAGNFSATSPAGRYLIEKGVEKRDFTTYGTRRGNHEVMVRGTFGNIRLRNRLLPGKEGYYTVHLPDGEETTMYEASERYKQEGVSQAKSTAPVVRVTGPPRGHCCWVCVPLSLKASSVSTAATSSAWASCRCSSNRAKTESRSD